MTEENQKNNFEIKNKSKSEAAPIDMSDDEALERALKMVSNPNTREMIIRASGKKQLPLWPEPRRAAPNEIVRSSLFNIRNHRVKREYYQDIPVVVLGDGEITYRGEELRQDDLDVWLQLMHLARGASISKNDIDDGHPTVKIVPNSFCRAINWPSTGHYYNKLETTLGRLSATDLVIKSHRLRKQVAVSMIRKRLIRTEDKEKRLGEWLIWLEPEIVSLFGGNYFSAVDWQVRKKLSALGKWLQAYYQSHREPYPIKVETILKSCGSSSTRTRDFKKILENALAELYEVGFLEKYYIKDGLVYVVRRKNQKQLS